MGDCGARCGINRARDRERETARALARRAWPGDSPDTPAPIAPLAIDAQELGALEAALRDALPVRTHTRGYRADGCASIYCVATVADSSWVEHRDHGADCPLSACDEGVRIALSPWGRFATLQEIILRATRDEAGVWLEERRVAGVEDRRLQHIVRGAQAILRRAGWTVLDAAFLAEPFGHVTLWQALFEADVATTTVGEYLRRA